MYNIFEGVFKKQDGEHVANNNSGMGKIDNKVEISGKLALKITNGDKGASEEFVKINYRWLLFVVRRKFANSNNHEDVVQDSFMLVISKLKNGEINEPITILAYLRSVAINIGFEYLRKDQKFISAIDSNLIGLIEDARENVDVLSNLEWLEKIKHTRKFIEKLKIQRDKDILIKFYFEDIDKLSICEQLKLSSNHFDRVLYRAKQRLMQLLPNDNYDYNDERHPKGVGK